MFSEITYYSWKDWNVSFDLRNMYFLIHWYSLVDVSFLTCYLHYSFGCLTHWGWVMHICVGKLTIIGSDDGLSPGQRQAIIWTNAGLLLIGPLGTNFSEILIKILAFSLKKMRLKVSSAKWRPCCLGLNMLSCNITAAGVSTVMSFMGSDLYYFLWFSAEKWCIM